MASINVTFAVFVLLAVAGVAGGALAASPGEDAFKIVLFVVGAVGSTGSFVGLRKFHKRRVEATGDPRTTVYSAFSIYSALFLSVLCWSLTLVILGRAVGWISENAANFVAYTLITDVLLLVFLLGCASVQDMRRPGLLARRVYLWPWDYFLRDVAEPNDPDATRNDADRNEDHHDAETHGESRRKGEG